MEVTKDMLKRQITCNYQNITWFVCAVLSQDNEDMLKDVNAFLNSVSDVILNNNDEEDDCE